MTGNNTIPNDVVGETTVNAVIVNYNAGGLLLESLHALLNESLLSEVWVIDNASSDQSMNPVIALQEKEPRLHVVRNLTNVGFGAANNIALIQRPDSDWLLVNPDCVVKPGVVDIFLRCRNQWRQAGVLGGLVRNPDGTEQRGCRRDLPEISTSALRSLGISRIFGRRRWNNFDLDGAPLPSGPMRVGAVSGALMYLNGDALKAVGSFDEGYFLHCEDLDICKRMVLAGWAVLFVPDAEAIHFQGTSSRKVPLRVNWYKHRSIWRYYRKFNAPKHNALLNALIWIGIFARFVATSVTIASFKIAAGKDHIAVTL